MYWDLTGNEQVPQVFQTIVDGTVRQLSYGPERLIDGDYANGGSYFSYDNKGPLIEGDGVCIGGGGWVIAAEVCFGLKSGKISGIQGVEKLNPPGDLTGTFTFYAGGSIGPGAGGRVVFGYTWVQQLWDYPDWIGRVPQPSAMRT